MRCLDSTVRASLESAINSLADSEDPVDVARCCKEQSLILYENVFLKQRLVSDPLEMLGDIPPETLAIFSEKVRVTDCHRVVTGTGYCFISATVRIPILPTSSSDKRQQLHPRKRKKKNELPEQRGKEGDSVISSGDNNFIQLTFRYERQPGAALKAAATANATRSDDEGNDHVGRGGVEYFINVSRGYDSPPIPLLWVKVFATGPTPNSSGRPAKNLAEGDDEGSDGDWEDISDEENIEESSCANSQENGNSALKEKQPRGRDKSDETSASGSKSKNSTNVYDKDDDDDTTTDCDRFVAGMDPEALAKFLTWTNLDKLNEDKAFFLLMTFPYYEHEFDLIGFVLDAVFGYAEDGEENDDDK